MVATPNSSQSENRIEDIKKLSQIRSLRAKEVLMVGKPKLVSEEEFVVPSSNGKDNYKVIHLDSWNCNCLDFVNTCQKIGIYCKHIKALQQFLKLRNNTQFDDSLLNEVLDNEKVCCVYCRSDKITKQGFRKNKNSVKQKYFCGNCSRFFINEPVKNIKTNTKVLCMVMDLYYKGLSLRDIQDTLKQFYNIEIHHETVRRYIIKFTEKIDRYVETKTPILGKERWHTDEQKVKVNGEWQWSWNTIDNETKFWIANNLTKGRSIKEAREQFQKVKLTAREQRPEILVTDGLHSYKKAIKKEFNTHKDRLGRALEGNITHVGNAGIRKKHHNNIVERLNGEFREFDKVRRGFKSDETTETYLKGMKIYHNFVKPHLSLNGLTPSQKANIDLKLNQNKWLSLIKKSVEK
ncbi:MAG: DDE-type integrase/transposase/recombinase [DPANN group archaeon]|nr:DDE-type integrase/transposase/recombinase [DPANN group archaeon]